MSNRLTADWIFAATRSPDQEVRGDLRVLKNRAREMTRNNPHARRFRRLLSHNVVGPAGIRLQAKVKNAKGLPDRNINRAIEDAWKRWCAKGVCTADGRHSFAQVQRLYIETMAVDGEPLVRLLPGFDNEFGFAIQVLDTDQLDVEYNRPRSSGRNEIRMGVEIDQWGRPVAYHLWDGHPTEFGAHERKRIRVPAEQIVHDFLSDRAGQTRGVSWYAPVLMRAKMLDGYEEATVVAARVGASHMGFFKPHPDTYQASVDDPDDDIPFEAEPATFKRLPIGMDFQQWEPNQPTTSFSEFDKAMLRSIATGLESSYSSLTGDLSDVNYSSIRQGKLDERDVWRVLQGVVIEGLLERVFVEWFKWAITTGALELPSRNLARWKDHEWQPRGWDWVDPLKDIAAIEKALANRLTSRTRVCAERGIDYEDLLAEIAAEETLAEEYGVRVIAPGEPAAVDPVDREEEEADRENAALLRASYAPGWINRIDEHLHGNGRHALNGNGKGEPDGDQY